MGMFEYVMVLASVILGLGITHILQSLVEAFQSSRQIRHSWVHLAWVAYVFLFTVFWWWWQFALQRTEVWTFQYYGFIILYAVIIYLWAAFVIPSRVPDDADYEGYFYSRRRWIFGVSLCSLLFDYTDTWAKGPAHLASLGLGYIAQLLLFSGLTVAAIWTKNKIYHAGFAIFALVYQLLFIFRAFNTMG